MGFVALNLGRGQTHGRFLRSQELGVLLQQVAAAQSSGRGRVLELAAEAGAGKSRLLFELGARLPVLAPEVLFMLGRARAAQSSTNAFQPFRRAVESLANTPMGATGGLMKAVKRLVRRAPTVLEQVPWVGAALLAGQAVHEGWSVEVQGAELTEHLDRALLDFFVSLARDRPVVLALDDMHWADSSSIDLVLELAERTSELPLVLLLAYRPDDIRGATKQHPLAVVLDRLKRYKCIAGHLELDRLTTPLVASLVADLLGAAPSAQLLRWLDERCAGNPFFVEEYVALLSERGALRIVSDEADIPFDNELSFLPEEGLLPDNIGGVLHERVGLLGEASLEFRVLQVACVLSGEFDVETVSEIGELDAGDTRRALSSVCQRSGLLRSTGQGYSFWHNLVREYIEQRLKAYDASNYRHLHTKAAERLERLRLGVDDSVAIARHLHEAERHDRAATACLSAADALSRVGGMHEAEHFAKWAWHHAGQVGDPVRQGEAGLASGRLLMDLRRVHAARTVLEETAELSLRHGIPGFAEVALELAKAHRMENDWPSARARLEEADAVIDASDHSLRARVGLLAGEIALCGSPQDLQFARSVLEAASSLALEDMALAACIWGHLALTELVLERTDLAEDCLSRARAAANASGSPASRFVVELFATHLSLARLDLETAGQSLREMGALADAHLISDADVDRYQGRLACLRGHPVESAAAYCRLLVHDLTLGFVVPEARSWALSHLTLQVDEVRTLRGGTSAAGFLNALADEIRSNKDVLLCHEPDLPALLFLLNAKLVVGIRMCDDIEVRAWHAKHGGWSSSAHASFDFYSADLVRLRERLRR